MSENYPLRLKGQQQEDWVAPSGWLDRRVTAGLLAEGEGDSSESPWIICGNQQPKFLHVSKDFC